MLSKLKNFFKLRWAYFISTFFVWIIPIIMLNETVALTETNAGFKLTFMGCLVLLFVFFAFRKKIYAFIHSKPHGILRGVLLCIHKAVSYGLVLGVLWAISVFSTKLYHWWLLCGVSILIGLIFLFIDEHLASKKEGDKHERSDI